MDWYLDSWVEVHLAQAQQQQQVPVHYTGQILSYLPSHSLVMLRCPEPRGNVAEHVPLRWTIRALKTSTISAVTMLKQPPADVVKADSSENAQLHTAFKMPALNIERLQQRESANIARERKRTARIGVGVTTEGQELFDILARTLPCEWRAKDILVLGEVVITAPYGVANVRAAKQGVADTPAVKRVKTIMEAEARRR